MNVIEVANIVKTYGSQTAINGVSFSVEEGEIFAILGPNGAGKTTTVESIAGLRTPDSGTISVLGLDPQHDRAKLRQLVGVQLQESKLPDQLRVWEALDLYASFYESPADWEGLIVDLGLADKRDAAFAKLSGGQKQRLSIALALVGNPRIAILDELTTGLDTPAGIVRLVDAEQRLRFRPSAPFDETILTDLPEVRSVSRSGPTLVVAGTGNVVLAVTAALARHQVVANDLRVEQADLDDAFIALTGRKLAS